MNRATIVCGNGRIIQFRLRDKNEFCIHHDPNNEEINALFFEYHSDGSSLDDCNEKEFSNYVQFVMNS